MLQQINLILNKPKSISDDNFHELFNEPSEQCQSNDVKLQMTSILRLFDQQVNLRHRMSWWKWKMKLNECGIKITNEKWKTPVHIFTSCQWNNNPSKIKFENKRK